MSRALFLAGALGLALGSTPMPAPADVYFETAYLPTSSVLGLSPGLLPTSYVVPTAFSAPYLPTSYVSTSAVLASDPVIYPTSTTYIRRSAFRPRRYVERTYTSYPLATTSYLSSYSSLLPTSYVSTSSLLPTSYVSTSSLLPTTYLPSYSIAPTSYLIDNGVVATSALSSSYPCETSTAPPSSKSSPVRPSNAVAGESGNTITSKPSNGGMVDERRPQGTVSGDEVPSSVVSPPVPAPVATPPAKPEPGATPGPQGLEGPKPEDLKIPLPGEAGGASPKLNETQSRSSLRPNYDRRNILRGRVVSADSRRPEEGVSVIVSNVTKNFTDRRAMTDAFGEFNVSLPDGDWTVNVKMPSGTVYPVGRDFVTASGGRVTDPSGRNVAEFVITR